MLNERVFLPAVFDEFKTRREINAERGLDECFRLDVNRNAFKIFFPHRGAGLSRAGQANVARCAAKFLQFSAGA